MRTLLAAAAICISLCASSQSDTPFDKAYFEQDKEGLKLAKSNLKDGDKIFDAGNDAYYNLAIPAYEAAQAFNPNNAELNFRLGVCYLHSAIKNRCLKHFEKAQALHPNVNPDNINFLLGRGHHLNEHWAEAVKFYEAQLVVLRTARAPEDEINRVKRFIDEAKNGMELSKEKERVWIDNLGSAINSISPEYAPLISTDERVLIITARRENSVGGLKDSYDNLPYEDLYISENVGGTWSPLRNMGEVVNTSGHDASSGLAPDGNVLFVFRGTSRGGGDVFVSRRGPEGWTKPKDLGKNINSNEHESAVALSYDGLELYFISERPGGFGGKDIYVSRWDTRKEEWGIATNLGPTVNSPYDEDGVFIHPDGKTLYYSSKGHNTIGGNDIFYSEKVDGKWAKPKNIGYPINTPDDDVFFVVAADGRTAYYSSIRPDGFGDKDIYRITFLGPAKIPVLNVEDQLIAGLPNRNVELAVQPEVKIRTSRMVLLKGLVLDDETGAPVTANIDLIDNRTAEILATFKSNPANGSYLVSLPAGRNYGLNFNADGYLFNSLNFDLPDTALFQDIYKEIRLKKIKVGKSIVLRNIFFDYNQFTIRSESKSELDRMKDLLVENPTIKVEISGHTDNVGGDAYNIKLSDDRAKAVVDHLVGAGIDQSRLTYKGYGKSVPIATNDTPEGRQENRRTEFKIVE